MLREDRTFRVEGKDLTGIIQRLAERISRTQVQRVLHEPPVITRLKSMIERVSGVGADRSQSQSGPNAAIASSLVVESRWIVSANLAGTPRGQYLGCE